MRRHGDRDLSDERIPGNALFVEQIIKEADERIRYQPPENDRQQKAEESIQETCDKENINIKEMCSGSRRRFISFIRR